MELAVRNCPLPILENIVRITALLHDAGKVSAEFQDYMESVRKYGEEAPKRMVDHTSAGGRMIRKLTKNKLLAELAATAIYSHHGLQDCINMDSGKSLIEQRVEKQIDMETIEERYFQIVDREMLMEYVQAASDDAERISSQIDTVLSTVNAGYCGVKDFYLGMYERLLLSVLIDSDWTDTSCSSRGELPPQRLSEERTQQIWEECICHYEKHINSMKKSRKESPLDVYRNEISERCLQAADNERNLYRLTVPTGAGKTLSSLRFALYHAQKYHKRHIFYVAPYNSILEQNAEEIRRAVKNEDYVLEHHCNVCHENEEEERVYKELTDSWDSPIIVTTAVQMLNTLFSGKKSSIRRMYSLCNSVIIFDEVQAFPVKGTELFHLAVNFLTRFCNTTVVLCSATQPSLAALPENNLFDCAEMTGPASQYADAFRRVQFEDERHMIPGGMQPEDLCRFALENFREFKTVLIVVNTKKCAQRVYEALRQSCGEECGLYHLSTNMCPENRKDELEEIRKELNSNRPVICVSTQLIEAGVDLSFGCVIRSLAGVDNIIQAAGRCNRHKEAQMGRVCIIKMAQDAERLEHLEDIRRAQSASETLLDYFKQNPEAFGGALDSETAVKKYYDAYFGNADEKITKYPSVHILETTLEELLGHNKPGRRQYVRGHIRRPGKLQLAQAFRTAGEEYKVIAEDERVTVVIPYDDTAKREIEVLENRYAPISEQKKAIRILQRYSVGISEHLEKELGEAIHKIDGAEVYVLSMDYYDKKQGVLNTPQNRVLIF